MCASDAYYNTLCPCFVKMFVRADVRLSTITTCPRTSPTAGNKSVTSFELYESPELRPTPNDPSSSSTTTANTRSAINLHTAGM